VTGEIDVLVYGRPSCDIVFSGLEAWPAEGREVNAEVLEVAAGAHFNTAAALKRLELEVAFAAVVGADLWGEIVLRDLRAEGLADEHVLTVDAASTPVSVALNQRGDRGFVTFAPGHEIAERAYVATTLELLATRAVRHVHCDLSGAARAVIPAAHEAGATVSIDAYDAGPRLSSPEVRELLSAADVVFVNELEALAITGRSGWQEAVDDLGSWISHLVGKRGAAGAVSIVEGTRHEVEGRETDLVDATGAGDCFAAGYLWAFLHARDAAECLALANLCGAAAVTRPGGYRGAPTLDDLLAAATAAGIVAEPAR
jgi:sugar/nucleoside kinase (ribokinase family)